MQNFGYLENSAVFAAAKQTSQPNSKQFAAICTTLRKFAKTKLLIGKLRFLPARYFASVAVLIFSNSLGTFSPSLTHSQLVA